jgi:ribulose-5-phosphate 4-epimerase/fuculose-1-phosphate aldolase
MKFTEIRREVYETAMKCVASGLVRLSAGNLSSRTPDGLVAVTPARIRYEILKPEDIAILDPVGKPGDAAQKPSSELPMHLAIYRGLPEVGAIVHTHSLYAITFAIIGMQVPVVNLEILAVGGPVPVAPWACPGTPEAGETAVEVFQARPGLKVCLLRNHGLLEIGENLKAAYENALNAETGMQTYYQALQIGQPLVMTPEQIEEINKVYGQVIRSSPETGAS